MTGTWEDLVTVGLEGEGWDEQEVRWVEKEGGVSGKLESIGGMVRKEASAGDTPGQWFCP